MLKFKDNNIKLFVQQAREEEDESIAKETSRMLDLPLMDLTTYPIEYGALGTIQEAESKDALIAPFHRAGKRLFVACINPKNPKTKLVIDRLVREGNILSIFICTHKSLLRAWDRYLDMKQGQNVTSGVVSVNENLIDEYAKSIKSVSDFKTVSEATLSEGKASITKMFEIILAGAYSLRASDIHIEPGEKEVRVRYRLDGVLHDVLNIPSQGYHFFKSRLKIVSGVKLNQAKEAQDGRFTIRIGAKDIEVRVSIIPGNYGESAVMRLLDPDSIKVSLETLGFEPYLKEVVFRAIARPNGIILLTGPTGSGKTTTLYAALRQTYSPEVKIITIENPIEYKLEGIVQTQVDNNSTEYTFAAALRAILRQDPEIIMVGEIRDPETAGTAIQAALTGHLVFSTVHANTAAGVIPRLLDMKVNPKILGSALTLSLAQRLLRRVCTNCAYDYEATPDEKKLINDIVAGMIGTKKQSFIDPFKQKLYTLRKGAGCDVCNGFGYKGRLAVHEAIEMNAEIERIAATTPSEREIQSAASAQGFLTLREDALLKILRGQTTMEEAIKVVDMYGQGSLS
jgi:type IV pilus assembly protein PilB